MDCRLSRFSVTGSHDTSFPKTSSKILLLREPVLSLPLAPTVWWIVTRPSEFECLVVVKKKKSIVTKVYLLTKVSRFTVESFIFRGFKDFTEPGIHMTVFSLFLFFQTKVKILF